MAEIFDFEGYEISGLLKYLDEREKSQVTSYDSPEVPAVPAVPARAATGGYLTTLQTILS